MISIVVAAYNRPALFRRVLKSIASADYGNCRDIPLILSIDRSEDCYREMADIAGAFHWEFGEKRVFLHDKRLGLREHFLFCGDLTREYGTVIFLEDDIVVSPHYFAFAAACEMKYSSDKRICAASLYNLEYNETAHRPFRPVEDGTDTWFLQFASWAPVYFPLQWAEFRAWYDASEKPIREDSCLPDNARKWRFTSFRKFHMKWSLENGKYVVYPRVSLATNFAEAGQHYAHDSNNLQVPLLMRPIYAYRLADFDQSPAIYDGFMEITQAALKRLAPHLEPYDFDVDLYGTKRAENMRRPYCLTVRKAARPEEEYARQAVPHEMNVILRVPGRRMRLTRTQRVSFGLRGLGGAFSDVLYDIKGASVLKVLYSDLWAVASRIKSRLASARLGKVSRGGLRL